MIEIEEKQELVSEYVQDYVEIIEQKLLKKPDKRRKEYQIWKNEMNKYIKTCNKLANIKIYNIIK